MATKSRSSGKKAEMTEVRIKTCYDCGSTMQGTRTYYRYTECGLDSVTLENIFVFRCGKCGAIVPEIPAIGELHHVIVLMLIKKDKLLSPQEIKFLRKMAGLNGRELSATLGASASTISRWENGSRKISKKADAALRLVCFAGMLQDILRDKDIVPMAARFSKELSEVDIRNILAQIDDDSDDASDSQALTIDPCDLSQLDSGPRMPERKTAIVVQ
jgi:putative zinc finger/helix-turn-helix YgiT family protein